MLAYLYMHGNRIGVDTSVISDEQQQSYVDESRPRKRRGVEPSVTAAQEEEERRDLEKLEETATYEVTAEAVPQEPIFTVAEEEKVPIPDEEEASSAPKRKERDSVDDLPFAFRESVTAQRLVDLPKRNIQQESTGQSSSSAGGTEPTGVPATQGVLRELASRVSARETQ